MNSNSDGSAPDNTEQAVEFVTVGRTSEVPPGEGRAFEVNERSIAVFHIDDQFYAIEDQCPHMGAALSTGFVENCVVACPWHAWRFDVRDGAWCDNPRVKIDAFETRVVGDELQIATTPKPKNP